MKHDAEKKRELKGKGKGSRPSRPPRRNSLERGTPTRKKSFSKGKPANMFRLLKGHCPERNAGDYWLPS